MNRFQTLAAIACAVFLFAAPGEATAEPVNDKTVGELSRAVMFGSSRDMDRALRRLVARGKTDVVPTLVLALRYRRNMPVLAEATSALTGVPITGWRDAMLWQEAQADMVPHPSYRELKVETFETIDPQFLRFLGGEKSRRTNLGIRLEEIVWGGVKVDGIPSLDNPKLMAASDASYLRDDDLVFGVEINGDARAYPLRIMGWNEMFNDTIGGVPVALAYCTLCGAGILFETRLPGRAAPLVFGSSGFLYRSNKLMFDRDTDSLWNQFTGRAVSGPLRTSGIELKIRPVVITSWKKWEADHPDTKVLSLNTGHNRNYGSGVVYRAYFSSPSLMFPTIVGDENRVRRKDYVFGIRETGAARAWPISAFEKNSVINDSVGVRGVVLIGDAATRTVRAYDRNEMTFAATDRADRVTGPGGTWSVTEDALIGPDGAKLGRVPGHISYWFAWDGYLGIGSTLFPAGHKS